MSREKSSRIREGLEVTEPGNILAKLFRKMLMDLGVGPAKFSRLIDQYVADVRVASRKYKNIKPVYSSTLTNKFTSTTMTWKVFLNAVFSVLRLKAFRLTITAIHANGKETEHSILVKRQKMPEINDSED